MSVDIEMNSPHPFVFTAILIYSHSISKYVYSYFIQSIAYDISSCSIFFQWHIWEEQKSILNNCDGYKGKKPPDCWRKYSQLYVLLKNGFLSLSGSFVSATLLEIHSHCFYWIPEWKCCKMICPMIYPGWNYYQNVLRKNENPLDNASKWKECDVCFFIFTDIMEWNMSLYSGWVLCSQWTQENTIVVSLYGNHTP